MIDAKIINQALKFRAVFTDEELDEYKKICQSEIDNSNSDSPKLLLVAKKMLKIFNEEVEERWWNRLERSNRINDSDIRYVKSLVNLRYVQACRLLGKDKDILEAKNEGIKQMYLSEANSMFIGFDIGLKAFKVIKGL